MNKSWIKRYFVLYSTSQGHFMTYYRQVGRNEMKCGCISSLVQSRSSYQIEFRLLFQYSLFIPIHFLTFLSSPLISSNSMNATQSRSPTLLSSHLFSVIRDRRHSSTLIRYRYHGTRVDTLCRKSRKCLDVKIH